MPKRSHNTLTLRAEKNLWARGVALVIGIDEAGMGPLAGPVCAAAVWLLPGFSISDEILASVYDSKKVSPTKRERIYKAFISNPLLRYAAGTASARTIDRINIRNAGILAMERAARKLARAHGVALSHATTLIDGTVVLPNFPGIQKSIVRGDQKIYSVAAASIIAKVTRDRAMKRLHKTYPHYGFAKHKGYGTREHYRALAKHGPSPAHRKTFL